MQGFPRLVGLEIGKLRLRDEIKRMKVLDLEFANEALTEEGEEVDRSAPKRWRADAAAEKAEASRKGRE